LAKFVATDFAISINSVPLSGNIAAATINTTANEVEITAFGNSHTQRTSGLKDASVALDFHQDFGAGSVHSILEPLLGFLRDCDYRSDLWVCFGHKPVCDPLSACDRVQPD
jgi:hypothetical protein